MRIIFVPQYPSDMRYSEWWYDKIPLEFRKRGYDVCVLGDTVIESIVNTPYDSEMFSPINKAIEFECVQLMEYMDMEIYDDDVLFLADISFPGTFCSTLYHKKCSRMYAFCHATSLNTQDYFEPDRYSKFHVESAHSILFDKVFVGSEYHKEKLAWKNTVVTYLPHFPFVYDMPKQHKTIDIMSASRPTKQKVDFRLEEEVETHFGKIHRPISETWYQYHENLQKSKVLLITSHEDTFGYQIVDAITNNCIPLARRSFAYPELLSDAFLYSSSPELIAKLDVILNWDESTYKEMFPKLLCDEEMTNFYDKICEEVKGCCL